MDCNIIQENEKGIKDHLGNFVRKTVEETLNAMLEAEAYQLCNAQRHERNTDRQGYRAGHYERKLLTKSGEVTLQVPNFYPEAKWQRCIVHFYRNVFSLVHSGKVKEVATMLKAIHAQENKEEAINKKTQIAEKMKAMKLSKAANLIESSAEETFSYYDFPVEHWKRIRTNYERN